jgi:hypothetical protein
VFKRVLRYQFLKVLLSPPFEHNKIPIWKTLLKIRVVVRSFCFGLILSPPLAWIAKNGCFEWNISPRVTTFSAFGKRHMSEDYTKVGELLGATAKDELWSGVEAFVFAEDSNSLSIHLWLGLKSTWKHISHSIYKRDMIKGILRSYVCKTSKEVPRIKNI